MIESNAEYEKRVAVYEATEPESTTVVEASEPPVTTDPVKAIADKKADEMTMREQYVLSLACNSIGEKQYTTAECIIRYVDELIAEMAKVKP